MKLYPQCSSSSEKQKEIMMMKMSKKVMLIFCLLISMFVVTQVHADKKYFLMVKQRGISIYKFPNDWSKLGEPVKILPNCITSSTFMKFNSDRTILCVFPSSGCGYIYFYKIPKDGDLSKIDEKPFFYIDVNLVVGAGFNPDDGTFYAVTSSPESRDGKNSIIRFYNLYPDAELEKDRCKKSAEFRVFATIWMNLIFKPDDSSIVACEGGLYLFPKHKKLVDHDVFESSEQVRLDGLICGFSPSGDILISKNSNTFTFLKIPKYDSWNDSLPSFSRSFDAGYKLGSVDLNEAGFFCSAGFLDNEHFYVSYIGRGGRGIVIYRVPPCDTWTKGSISTKSFQEIAVYDGVSCIYTQLMTRNEKEFRDNLNEGKPRQSYHDLIITAGEETPFDSQDVFHVNTIRKDNEYSQPSGAVTHNTANGFTATSPLVVSSSADNQELKRTLLKQSYSISKWHRDHQCEDKPDGSKVISCPVVSGKLIFELPMQHLRQGQRIAMTGTLTNGALYFGLVSSDKKHWHGVGSLIDKKGDFVVSPEAPYEGDFFPTVEDRSSPTDVTVKFEVKDIRSE